MRRPSSAPGWIRPGSRRFRPVLVPLLVLALAGCASSIATGSPAQPTPIASPEASAGAPASASPSAETPSGSPGPSAQAPGPSAGSSPSPSGTAGGGTTAAACSGSPENRSFYASMAAAVSWPVYCPVLDDGWFVQSGQYRLANGGQLEIQYQGPNRAQITLDEGGFCAIQGGCVPPGVDVGPTAFGNRDGTLVALDDGSWAVVADREGSPSWLLVVTGLDEAATRTIAARLAVVQH